MGNENKTKSASHFSKSKREYFIFVKKIVKLEKYIYSFNIFWYKLF